MIIIHLNNDAVTIQQKVPAETCVSREEYGTGVEYNGHNNPDEVYGMWAYL